MNFKLIAFLKSANRLTSSSLRKNTHTKQELKCLHTLWVKLVAKELIIVLQEMHSKNSCGVMIGLLGKKNFKCKD